MKTPAVPPGPEATGPVEGPRPASLGADHATGQILERLRVHGTKGERYVSRGEIARGGMGMILRVWDDDLRRELAMKVVLGGEGRAAPGEIAPKTLGRFLEEAQVTGQLDHPGIVPVHELGLDEQGSVYFTMRLVRGRDLKAIFELVHAGDPEWTLTRVLWILLKVCDAMAYAHSKGVIHRDLKPANVMVGRFGEVYVMDWGLARVLGQPDRHDLRLRTGESSLTVVQSERRADASHSADSVLFTMDGDVVGTPAYMSPEQARGQIEQLGPASDVYSLGAMLYHLLTGQMPYSLEAKVSQHMVLRWVLEGPPPSVHAKSDKVPEELVAICEKAMARDSALRYPDMGALGSDLRAYLENRVVQASRRGAWIEFQKWVQRNRGLAIAWATAMVVALCGLGATAWVQVRGRKIAEDARAAAQASEQAARENLAEAQRQEAIARRERSNVLRLSAFQELEDLEREADALWPAIPAREKALESWLARAQRLIAGLEPAGDDPGHRPRLAELRARVRPVERDEIQRRVEAHPRGGELVAAQAQLDALRAAETVRSGRAHAQVPELDPGTLPGAALELNALAWPLVDPDRSEFGREGEGLALARLAFERAEPEQRPLVLDTLAWASFGCGLDEEAVAASREAVALVPSGDERFEGFLSRVARQVQHAHDTRSSAEIAAATARLAALQREVLGSTLPGFASEDDRWWHAQLELLVQRIEDFADPARGLVRGISPAHGWGIERRLGHARALEERTRGGSKARPLWSAALAEIRDPATCPAYEGLELAPQLGLVPLGRDPDSLLHEFADVATGTPPQRDAAGQLELTPESSVVFVLVPGGRTRLGAQALDPLEPHHDPLAEEYEQPVHEVELEPFFLAKHELTQGQWRRFAGGNPSNYLAGTIEVGVEIDERAPLEQVSWVEASRVLARLGWDLPTEAQWEHAARAGTSWPWWTGEEPDSLQGACNVSDRFARASGGPWMISEQLDDGYFLHAPVGSFEANLFGLHDTIGNVFEWCRDRSGTYDLPVAPLDGERIGGNPSLRVLRGGSYATPARMARSSARDSGPPGLANEVLGVRPMRRIER